MTCNSSDVGEDSLVTFSGFLDPGGRFAIKKRVTALPTALAMTTATAMAMAMGTDTAML